MTLKQLYYTTSLLLILWLQGCAGADIAVGPATELPVPLVPQLPITMGLYLSDELTNYAHTEELAQNGSWRIEVGSVQQLMFSNLASGMFNHYEVLAALPGAVASQPVESAGPASRVDAILVPAIAQMQFAIPSQTRSDFFEVWIRYKFQLLSPTGAPIAEFPLEGYGKANARNYGFMEDTANGALHEAARVALRDAMAFFTLRFQRVPEIARWLQQLSQPQQPGSAAHNSTSLGPRSFPTHIRSAGDATDATG